MIAVRPLREPATALQEAAGRLGWLMVNVGIVSVFAALYLRS